MSEGEPSTAASHSGGLFPATMWSAISQARAENTPTARDGLEKLARAYWRPLYIFLRQRGAKEDAAADAVQGFFAHLLAHDFLTKVRVREGKFRTFLLASLTNWLSDERARASTQKRGGGVWHVSLENIEEQYRAAALSEAAAPEEAYDRGWARSLFELAISRLAQETSLAGRGPLFEALRGTLTGEPGEESYARIGARLGMTEGAVKKAAFDLRARLAAELRSQVREPVRDDAAVDDELRYLIRLLRS